MLRATCGEREVGEGKLRGSAVISCSLLSIAIYYPVSSTIRGYGQAGERGEKVSGAPRLLVTAAATAALLPAACTGGGERELKGYLLLSTVYSYLLSAAIYTRGWTGGGGGR